MRSASSRFTRPLSEPLPLPLSLSLSPAEAARRRPFLCWGVAVVPVVPPQSAGGMIHAKAISSVGAKKPVIPTSQMALGACWEQRAVSKASTLAGVTVTATMGPRSASLFWRTLNHSAGVVVNWLTCRGGVDADPAPPRLQVATEARPLMAPPGPWGQASWQYWIHIS
ncbi:hypothetical protein EDB81DRAFT_438124 [Dactylonectria macrodidyma]|uniref:Uncharacterized protein n=1 Tax=Dactylonectria macrodidyma TaxID=307937 RepID=A0A9P9F4D5_9HYPO|nr:hypothetical protein EDB81DRAFT_438124 [Dactylonectria macrodidyma]